jgi:shikimate 5-dehydrogenase
LDFVFQAAVQFKLFFGKEPPVDLMRQSVLDSLSQ